MYSNLKAEMARRDITMTKLAVAMGVQLQTISKKINGDVDFTLGEAYTIKEFLKVDMPLEELFEKGKNA